VRLSLRQPWRDGTTDLVFTPLELLERLAVLVPRPRINLILYFGVLGARATARAEMAGPGCPGPVSRPASSEQAQPAPAHGKTSAPVGGRNQSWAALMQRTFGLDVLACPRCGGRLRLIALIEQQTVITRVLEHLGVPTELPVPRPARPPPDEGWLGKSAAACDIDLLMSAS
jgi:hypothetical protein